MPAIYTKRHGAAVLKDATGTPIEANLSPGNGDFTCSDLEQGQLGTEVVLDRGDYYERVLTDWHPVTGSITLHHDGVLTSSSGDKVPLDAVMKTGDFASGVTTEDGGVTWTTDLVFTTTRGGTACVITVAQARCTASYAEGNNNAVTINYEGKSATIS